jgi:hypothetical protein
MSRSYKKEKVSKKQHGDMKAFSNKKVRKSLDTLNNGQYKKLFGSYNILDQPIDYLTTPLEELPFPIRKYYHNK